MSQASRGGADDARPAVGHGKSALPAVELVPVLTPRAHPLRAHAALDYGYTEGVLKAGDGHHRSALQLALSHRPLDWLSVAGRFDTRLDTHTGGEDGGDEGVVTQSTLIARAEAPVSGALRVGGEVALRLPGASSVERSFAGVSPELRALATLAPHGAQTRLSGALGVRFDRARYGVSDIDRLSLHDRVGLGASDSNAVLFGVGLVHGLGALDLLGELSWDLQVGPRACEPLESPLRIVAGARYFATHSLHVQLLGGVSPSARPSIALDEPLYVIEPRLWLSVGLGLYFGAASAPPAARPAPAVAPPIQPPVAPTARRISGRVLDGGSHLPYQGAILEVAGMTSQTDVAGQFAFEALPVQALELRARAGGFADAVVTVAAGTEPVEGLELMLERELPDALIRGTVHNFKGLPVPGRVIVQPGGLQAQLDSEGRFELEVAPGTYTVLINAPGYALQQRQVRVEQDDVAVIIVELRAER